ncbi:MAG: hypothetical protein OXF75_08805 [Acidimicrobiaceae bacterium]|nr:hypothetical protein [Acidimicrobiaceae bacterium]
MAGYTYELEAVLNRADPLARVFESAGYRFFLVGGVVRDYFLKRFDVGQDLDATTDARPDAIRALVSELADDVWSQGERFGTIGCIVAGHSYEVTTHRAESYVPDSRKPTVVFGDDVVDDLARRDFTVNAMAIDMADRSLVDPFGGEADLEAGVLRTPLEPEASLSEDPLRMLRAARFCASCALSPAPDLVAAMTAERDRLEIVSVERIRDELQKLLLLDDPAAGLGLIDATGVGRRVPVVGGCDGWESAARRLRTLPTDPAMRWAGLLSALQVVRPDLRLLKFSRDLDRAVMWLLREAPELSTADLAALEDRRLRELAGGCPAGRTVEDLLTFVAGLRAGDGLSADDVDQMAARLAGLRGREPDWDDPAPFFSGLEVAEMLGIEPGPELGRAMNWLAGLRVAEGPLDADTAAARLQDWWAQRTRE